MGRRRKSDKLVGAAVGSGIVARAAEQGGADFLLAINAGRLRSMGVPSIACMLPIHHAADLTWEFATSEILPITDLPVYVGVNCWTSAIAPEDLAQQIMQAGFAGAVNFPTTMHYSDAFQHILDRAGLGTRQEIALLQAVQAAGGKSMFYCGTRNQARMGADAGLQALVCNFGWNLGGALGHQPRQSLEEAAQQANEVSRFVKKTRPDLQLYLEGGPIAEAADLSFVSQNAEIDGYVGGSTFDRVPIETSIGDHIAGYRLAMDAVVKPPTQDRKLMSAAASCGLFGEGANFYRALEAIRRAANSSAHLVVCVPPGGPRSAILNLLEKLRPKPKRGGYIELDQDRPDRAGLLEAMFGRSDVATSQAHLRRENTHLVIHGFDALPNPLHSRLVRLLETGAYTQSGSSVRRVSRARVVLVVEHAEAMQLPQDGEHVMHLRFPDLASRSEEIATLLGAMFQQLGAQPSLVSKLSPAIMQRLRAHLWHGNEDELRRVAQDCLAAIPAGGVTVEFIENRLSVAPTDTTPNLSITPKQHLLETLARHNFRRTDTARALNISRKTLYNRMRKFDLL